MALGLTHSTTKKKKKVTTLTLKSRKFESFDSTHLCRSFSSLKMISGSFGEEENFKVHNITSASHNGVEMAVIGFREKLLHYLFTGNLSVSIILKSFLPRDREVG